MNAFAYLLSTAGTITYNTLRYPLQLLPQSSQKNALITLDALEGTVSLLFGPLLLPPQTPHVDMTGKVALITGANSGIGLSIGEDLARMGATVYLGCRNLEKAAAAREDIVKRHPSSAEIVHTIQLDTSDLDSVRKCVSTFKHDCSSKLDILIHNAGISVAPDTDPYSPQRVEIIYATNILGAFFLTYLLEERLAADARVIFTTSNAQYAATFSKDFSTEQVINRREDGFHYAPGFFERIENGAGASQPLYANSKCMQAAFARLLQQRFDEQVADGKRRVAHCFEPGFTTTNMIGTMSEMTWKKDPIFRSLVVMQNILATDVKTGAATGLWLATTSDRAVVEEERGGYWSRNARRLANADLMSDGLLRRFWARWEADAGVEWR